MRGHLGLESGRRALRRSPACWHQARQLCSLARLAADSRSLLLALNDPQPACISLLLLQPKLLAPLVLAPAQRETCCSCLAGKHHLPVLACSKGHTAPVWPPDGLRARMSRPLFADSTEPRKSHERSPATTGTIICFVPVFRLAKGSEQLCHEHCPPASSVWPAAAPSNNTTRRGQSTIRLVAPVLQPDP